MEFVEVTIEETVELDRNYPRVHERYFTEYFYVQTDRNKLDESKTTKECESTTNGFAPTDENSLIKKPVNLVKEIPIDGSETNLVEKSREDTCVMIHSNKLCLLTLSHHHPILSKRKQISKVNFDVGKFNRLENQVSGKGKRGAQMIGPKSPLCIITCTDGSTYTILAGVNGKLVEVNEYLQNNPQLLSDSPKEEGYLAIVLPPLRNGNVLLNRLLSREQYEAVVKNSEEELVN